MLVINYNGNKPINNSFSFSVNGNNNADIVRFVVAEYQDYQSLSEKRAYVSVENDMGDFVDKVELSAEDIRLEDNVVVAEWKMLRKHTLNKVIYVSLSFENDSVVWKTQAVKIAINNGVNADDEMENSYPTYLEQLEERIEELEKGGGSGGGSNEVEIKRVYLTYDTKKSIRDSYLGTFAASDVGEDAPFTNDSTRIWVNFETSPISAAIENEIKKGRFIIRLDYPIKNNGGGGAFDTNKALNATNQRDKGAGVRSYTYSFKKLKNNPLKQKILDSLIFVNEDDIKVNRYGEKYIIKKISLFEYIENMCACSKGQFAPITLEYIGEAGGTGRLLFEDYLLNKPLGIPTIYDQEKTNILNHNNSLMSVKMFNSGHTPEFFTNNRLAKKTLPAFSCYAPLKLEASERVDVITIFSRYLATFSKTLNYSAMQNYFVLAAIKNGYVDYMEKRMARKLSYMAAKPRCAILNDDYENADYSFLKTFKQSDQQIKLYCKCILPSYDDYGFYVPIFRMLITHK